MPTTEYQIPIYHPARTAVASVTRLQGLVVVQLLGLTVTFALDKTEANAAIVMTTTRTTSGQQDGFEGKIPQSSVRVTHADLNVLCYTVATRWDRVLAPLGVDWLGSQLRTTFL